jgi:hypothetical protein
VTPAIWTDVQDDLRTAVAAAQLAAAKAGTLAALTPDARFDREIAVGKLLHDAYSAAENALQRILLVMDKELPVGGAFHRELIDRAARPIPAARPSLISAATADGLGALLRFRHVFRHSYEAFEFGRAAQNVAIAAATIPRLRDELTAFAASLGLAARP